MKKSAHFAALALVFLAPDVAGREFIPASATADGIPRLPQYRQTPAGAVQATPLQDAWVRARVAHIAISSVVPGDEFAEGLDARVRAVPGTSRGNSLSGCPVRAVLCLHTHPLQDVGNSVRLVVKLFQPWRLGFGVLDDQPLLSGMPNYMLNYQRRLQVLEYTPARGYAVRDLGVIAYAGPASN
jgi:hypothetical protein